VGSLAVILLSAEEMRLFLTPEDPVRDDLVRLGLRRSPPVDGWSGEPDLLEPVCSLLDAAGYRWAADTFDAPRTWPQRLFAECSPHLAEELYAALRSVLVSADGDPAHLSLLDTAWRGFNRSGSWV